MYALLSWIAEGIARTMAIIGGLILLAVIGLTVASIVGRALLPLGLGLGPIKGIYDITEIGIAAAVFAFLPWCQIRNAHAAVDLFKPAFGDRLNHLLNVVIDLGMFAIASVGAWRLYLGMLDKLRYGETTLIAQLPVWQGYLASLIGAVAFALVAAFCVLRSVRVLTGFAPAKDIS
ncbi:TRAP transporter small permease [Yoonia sp.]|uniref:TRAP transporter small permease n=1 Tax=Yoonia sp. TaxID=2212373 RepID=UPI003F6C7A1C